MKVSFFREETLKRKIILELKIVDLYFYFIIWDLELELQNNNICDYHKYHTYHIKKYRRFWNNNII